MFNSTEAEQVSRLVNHVDGVAELPATELTATVKALRIALADALSARVKAQQSALARRARDKELGISTGGKGRPPSTVYEVAVGSLWEARVAGRAAVMEQLAQIWERYALTEPMPTMNNISTTMSTKGSWWRHVDTDYGEQDITVRRLGTVEELYPDGAPTDEETDTDDA